MTAETSTNDAAPSDAAQEGTLMAGRYVVIAAALFVLGLIASAIAAFQLVLPDLASGVEFATYGRLAPASRVLVVNGWLPIAGLGLAYYVLTRVTGVELQRRTLGTVALVLIGLGSLASAGGILFGLSSGISGQEGPIWARAVSAAGVLLASLVITATAKQNRDRLGITGWYLVAAPWWLAASALFGLIPLMNGTAGTLQAAFASVGLNHLFAMSIAVGLLYFALSTITGADATEPRPLGALGFWSLTLTWAFMGGSGLIYSPTPDWYETLTISFAIAALVPVLAIVTDLGLLLKGQISSITDRASLRYSVVAGLALVTATIVNLLFVWRATGAVVQYSTWGSGLDAVIVLGGASFAIFAANSVRKGGSGSGMSLHFVSSMVGITGIAVGLLTGGIVTGFSWIAGPSSQLFPNYGFGYEVAVVSLQPFLWVAAVSLFIYLVAQIVYLFNIGGTADEELAAPDGPLEYNLELEGSTRYVTWKRLAWGAGTIWVASLLFTAVMPILDTSDTDATITADRFRTYESGTPEAVGRALYISEGCAECHTQSVRPIVADVGLGPVSIAGDYAHENPAIITGTRIGPDLMHTAGREEPFDKEGFADHLKNPRSNVEWSTMPSYSYLSGDDIAAIASYIETLR